MFRIAIDISTYKLPHGGEVVVAVKPLRPSVLRDKVELASFVEEAKLLRKLSHRCSLKPCNLVAHQHCPSHVVLSRICAMTSCPACWPRRCTSYPAVLKAGCDHTIIHVQDARLHELVTENGEDVATCLALTRSH